MSAKFDQLPAAIVGQIGELASSDLMKADGASVIALCRIDTGGAPVLERGAVRGKSVLPDYQVFNWRGHPGACFFEIKTYEQARQNHIESRRNGYPVFIHGIPVRLYDHYCATERDTGLPVFLAINELDTGEMRISEVPLSSLPKIACSCKGGCRSINPTRHVHVGRGIREMQWYFDREFFSVVYRHSDKTIERLRKEHTRLLRPGHALRRHGYNEPAPRDGVMTTAVVPSGCQHCGKIEDCMFRVGSLDQSGGYVLCGFCWRAGVQPEQSKRQRDLRGPST